VPGLSAALIEDACHALANEAARVIAPATDGGFVLFGANADLDADPWSEPAYGVPGTAEQFLALIGTHLPVQRLKTQQDLDTQADLRQLAKHPPEALSAQQSDFWGRIPAWSR